MTRFSGLFALLLAAFWISGPVRAQATNPSASAQADSVFHQMVVFSPDGSLLAWSERSTHRGADEAWSIWLAPVDGSQRLRITEGDPFFSFHPDGSRIVFSRSVNGASELFHIRIDGRDEKQITNDGADRTHPWVTPDGRTILHVMRPGGSAHIARIDIEGKGAVQLTEGPGDDLLPSLSPDERLIVYYRSTGDGKDQIRLMKPDGTNDRAFTDGTGHNFFPVWTPDDYVSWISDSDKGQRTIKTSPTTLFRPLEKPVESAHWQVFSRDGRQRATIEGRWPLTWITVSDAGGSNSLRVIN